MRRTVAEFHDHLLSEEQKLTRIEDYVAGKQRLPSERDDRPGHNQAASSATKPTNSPKSAGDSSRRVKHCKDNAVERAKKSQEQIIQTKICASSSSDSSDPERGDQPNSEAPNRSEKVSRERSNKSSPCGTVAMTATVLSKIPKFKPTSKISWLELVEAQLHQTDLTDTQKVALLCDKIPDKYMDVIAQDVKAHASFDKVCAALRKHLQVPDRVKIKVLQRQVKLGDQTPSAAMRHALAEADIPTNPSGTFGSWVKEAFIKFRMIYCKRPEKDGTGLAPVWQN